MPDPIEELENFSIQGSPMNPMPAAEVRRRGDRIRRRNNAIATVGGLAVIAAIATPFAVVAAGGNQSQQPVSPADRPPNGWTTTVPAGFDLGALPAGAGFTFDVRDESVVDNVRVCGEEAYSTSTSSDTSGALWGEGNSEGSAGRTLAVYADEDAARAALDDLRQAVLDCPEDGELVNAEADLQVPGAEDAFLWTNQAQDGTLLHDTTGYQAVQVGNAIYLATTFSSAGEEQADTVGWLLRNSAPVVDQLCTFSVEGCADEPTGLAGTIPDDFPLEAGLPTDAGLEGPSRDIAPIVLDCGGSTAEVPEHVDLLRASNHAPGEDRERQLVLFGSEDEAQAYLRSVTGLYQNCGQPTVDGKTQLVQAISSVSGYDAAGGAHIRWERGGQPVAGYETVVVIREGNAVLLSTISSDEGVDRTGALIQQQTTTAFESVSGVVDAMS